MPIATAKSAIMTRSTNPQYHVTAYAAASTAAGNGDVSDCVLRVRVRQRERSCGPKYSDGVFNR